MSLTLTVDGDHWRTHLRPWSATIPVWCRWPRATATASAWAGSPARPTWLGVDTLAVGTYDELPEVSSRFSGDLLVMTPWRPFGAGPGRRRGDPVPRVHTLSRVEDVRALSEREPDARFVLELQTSMLRHGLTARDLREAADALGPAAAAAGSAGSRCTCRWPPGRTSRRCTASSTRWWVAEPAEEHTTLWVSHLTGEELGRLRTSHADFSIRPRIGTSLWLGDRAAL